MIVICEEMCIWYIHPAAKTHTLTKAKSFKRKTSNKIASPTFYKKDCKIMAYMNNLLVTLV